MVADTIKCNCADSSTKAKPISKHKPAPIIKPFAPASTQTAIIVKPSFEQLAKAIQKIYTSYIGVGELTGNNDGKEVELFLRSVGLIKGNAWCAAFVHYCLSRGGVPNSVTGWSPTSFNKNNVVWLNHSFIKKPHYSDVVSFYFPPKKRIAHTGFFNRDLGNGWYESVEGNTGNKGVIGNIVREGDGVYRKKRSYATTYAMSRHIK